ncbi:MAG: DUF1614 domain-containing protein [Limnochordia bacterium]|jgi:uncharacterized membrane protein|nr:DUF1614 domain-containing protein [Bacillota bacterium]
MLRLAPGISLLVIISALIFFGLAQRVLDRMRLTDRSAILLLLIMVGGYYLPEIPFSGGIHINIGGIVPLGVAIYLIATSDSPVEKSRGIAATLGVMILVLLTDRLLPIEPGFLVWDVDPVYTAGAIAAVLGYLLGRSRRLAFASAVGGLALADLIAVLGVGIDTPQEPLLVLGGAGLFDVLMISGVGAVILAELVGEIRERIHRGPNVLIADKEDEDVDGEP